MNLARHALPLLLLAPAFAAQAQQANTPTPNATWEQLSEADRAVLLQPLRERWNNADAAQRQRMYQHAARWRDMTPEQRAQARKGMGRFERLSPDQQAQMRALFDKTRGMDKQQRRETFALFHAMRDMTPAQRTELRAQWAKMNPQQRETWVREHAPPHRSHHGDRD